MTNPAIDRAMLGEKYDDLLLEEAAIEKQLENREIEVGRVRDVPITKDRDPNVTTALRERLNRIRAAKAQFKDRLDPMDRATYDLYEEFLRRKDKGE